MKFPDTIHSVHNTGIVIEGELDRYTDGSSFAICYDIGDPDIPEEFYLADVVYGEPPWRYGYKKYYEKIGKTPVYTYNEFLGNLMRIIRHLEKPTFMAIGKDIAKHTHPEDTRSFSFYGADMVIGSWYAKIPDTLNNETDLRDYVGSSFGTVLDPVCGYGNIARVAMSHGNKFICSDLNRNCIYHVAKQYMGYSE